MNEIFLNKEKSILIDIKNCNDIKIDYLIQGYYIADFYYSLDKNILKISYNDEKENVDFLSIQEKRKIKKLCLKEFYNVYNKIKKDDYIKKQLKTIKKYLNKLEYYERRKTEIIEEAQNFQFDFSNNCYSYGELAEIQGYFEKQGKRYGLLKEFRENCII